MFFPSPIILTQLRIFKFKSNFSKKKYYFSKSHAVFATTVTIFGFSADCIIEINSYPAFIVKGLNTCWGKQDVQMYCEKLCVQLYVNINLLDTDFFTKMHNMFMGFF